MLDRRPVVILCSCRGKMNQALDLPEVARRLQERTNVVVADNLCQRPGAIRQAMETHVGAPLVLGACAEEDLRQSVEEEGGAEGQDRVLVPVVHLRERVRSGLTNRAAAEVAARTLLAAARRSQAHCNAGPDNLRPRLPGSEGKMGRRAFLGRVRLRQELVPAVVPGRCVAHHGCQLCRHSCPHDAIVLDSPVARIEKDHCLACGMCVPACPRDAITFPGFGETELVEQMNVLLSGKEHGEGNEEGERQWGSGGAGGSPTLLFTCRVGAALLDRLDDRAIRSAVSVRELPVPCLGMVTPDLMLQALFQGAGAVGLLGCLERCRSGFTPDRLQARVGFVRELLSGLGQAPDRVEALDATGGHGLVQRLAGLVDRAGVLGRCRMVAGRTGRIGRYESLLALDLSPAGEEPQRLLGEAVPLGLVEVDRERCSVCGLCAARCPTGALSFAGKSGSLSLRFRHSSCAACQICSSVCPEKALVMRRALDLDGLRKGGWVLVESGVTRCRGCGEPLAPAALSHRLRDRLQKSGTSSNLAYLADWCSNCRVVRRDQEQATRN